MTITIVDGMKDHRVGVGRVSKDWRTLFNDSGAYVFMMASVNLWWVFSLLLVVLSDAQYSPWSFESLGLLISILGLVFGVFSLIEAHAAAVSSNVVLLTIQSFRHDFRTSLKSMIDVMRSAKRELYLLLPTPAYGLLFGQPDLSRELVEQIVATAKNQSINFHIVLIDADLPQKYLDKARGAGIKERYVGLVEEAFGEISNHDNNNNLFTLRHEPYVRLVIADPDEDEAAAFMAFVQDGVETRESKKFGAKGFLTSRQEMVVALKDLFNLYIESSERVGPSGYVTNQRGSPGHVDHYRRLQRYYTRFAR